MYALVSLEKVRLPAGAVVRLPATWGDYESLCEGRGDGSIPRIKYRPGEVLLMSPLAGHGKDASLIADIIKVFLDKAGYEYDSYTPVTLKLPSESGIEPDYMFYIDNWRAVVGKKRIDWRNDPPPDLVLEIDVTSYSDVNDYLPFKVPEVWLWRKNRLWIYVLEGEEYIEKDSSKYFPDMDLKGITDRCVALAYEQNTSVAIRDLRGRL